MTKLILIIVFIPVFIPVPVWPPQVPARPVQPWWPQQPWVRSCMFDNLPPGVYGISCPCPRCSTTCGSP